MFMPFERVWYTKQKWYKARKKVHKLPVTIASAAVDDTASSSCSPGAVVRWAVNIADWKPDAEQWKTAMSLLQVPFLLTKTNEREHTRTDAFALQAEEQTKAGKYVRQIDQKVRILSLGKTCTLSVTSPLQPLCSVL